MDEGEKIARGIVTAALVLAVAYVGYREFDRWRTASELQAIAEGFSASAQQAIESSRVDAVRAENLQRVRAAFSAGREAQHRRLAPNQRCVGGAVVQVDGRTFTQIGSIQQPVHCAGVYADRPLR